MADEWYLMSPSPNRYNGFDDDDFNYFAVEGFDELRESFIGTEVTLYNYDLSLSQIIKSVVQGNIAESSLKSLERTFLFPIGTVKAGMYVLFDNSYWIINGFPGNNKIYEKVTAVLCQYLLRWQNSNHEIVERWINLTSAAKYDIGKSGNKTITLTTNNFTITIPNDEESLNLDGKRVFIDQRTDNPTKVFEITRNDDSPYYYGKHGGVLNLIANKTEFNKDTDNQELRICNYSAPPPPLPNETDISSIISGDANLKIGRNKDYSAAFYDTDGNELLAQDFQWKIQSDFSEHIQSNIDGTTIKLRVDNRNYIGSSLLLQIIKDGKLFNELKIQVSDIY